jgi:hypothetical protein
MTTKDVARPIIGYSLKGLGWLTERYVSHYIGAAVMKLADLLIG